MTYLCIHLLITATQLHPTLPLIARYFHAYRIDHILGFFRIWELPADTCSGILGRFRPSIPLSRSVSGGVGLRGTQQQGRAAQQGSICRSGCLPHPPHLPILTCPQELEGHGIWDFDRLCQPWITDEVGVWMTGWGARSWEGQCQRGLLAAHSWINT